MKENSKKKEIRDKAIQLFKEKGFSEVTLNDICKASSISKNTFYYYFESKECLLNEELKAKPLSQEDLAELLLIESPYEQYCTLLRKHISHFQGCGREIMKRALLGKLTEQFDSKKFHEKRQYFLKLQESMIEKAQQQNEILNLTSPTILAKAAISMLIGLSQIWTTDQEIEFNLEEEYFKLLDALMQKKG